MYIPSSIRVNHVFSPQVLSVWVKPTECWAEKAHRCQVIQKELSIVKTKKQQKDQLWPSIRDGEFWVTQRQHKSLEWYKLWGKLLRADIGTILNDCRFC